MAETEVAEAVGVASGLAVVAVEQTVVVVDAKAVAVVRAAAAAAAAATVHTVYRSLA